MRTGSRSCWLLSRLVLLTLLSSTSGLLQVPHVVAGGPWAPVVPQFVSAGLVPTAPTSGGALATQPFTTTTDLRPAPRPSHTRPAPADPALRASSPLTSTSNSRLTFIPNHGQTDPAVQFQAPGQRSSIFFTAHDTVLTLPVAVPMTSEQDVAALRTAIANGDHQAVADAVQQVSDHEAVAALDAAVMRGNPQAIDTAVAAIARSSIIQHTSIQLHLEGTRPSPVISGTDPLPGVVHYLRGTDPSRWQTNLPTYGGIVYQELYDGIDLHYTGQMGQLKGTYLVAPGADPSVIRWRYTGVANVTLNAATGTLHSTLRRPPGATAHFTSPVLTEHAPSAWQEMGHERVAVAVRYDIAADGKIGFVLGDYDPTLPLVIDPVLDYSVSLDGSSADYGLGIAVDSSGNAYVTGYTASTDFPTTSGAYQGNQAGTDAFVTKLNSSGSALVFSTYLGHTGVEYGYGIAVNSSGNAFVGRTETAQQGTDAYVQKLHIERTLYVDADATGANTGTSWQDAYTSLLEALDVAIYGDDIWVAAGTYKPHTSNRSVSFVLPDGVGVYGGFAGTETSREQRDWRAHETILSGDLHPGWLHHHGRQYSRQW